MSVVFITRFECSFSAKGVIELHITRDSRNYCFVKFDTVQNTDDALRNCCKPPNGGNLQSYLITTRLRKLTVVFEYYEAKETYSRI